MFEEVLFNDIKTAFPTLNLFFGEAPESTVNPYTIMYVLNRSGRRVDLSESNNFESGSSFVQFNIYTSNPAYGLNLSNQLDVYLNELRYIDGATVDYDVWSVDESSNVSLSADNGLSVNVLAKTINYKEK